jgi:A/G-specific adenine glycosylase
MNSPAVITPRGKNVRFLTTAQIQVFRKKIYDYFDAEGRDLPWRKRPDPYRVLVSEIMLQQTQVERVIEKYQKFLAAFPDFSALANAPLTKLLALWSGLGYNRRALALKALAQKVVEDYGGKLPSEAEELIALPGIGKYTAGAVMTFAFNKPMVFIDTNIRRVYIHEFLWMDEKIHDHDLMPLVEQTIDDMNPRKWYNALMDYGAMLKLKHVNPNRKSIHYVRQSPFENSNRQVRGKILKALVTRSPLTIRQLVEASGIDPQRIQSILAQLAEEGFIKKRGRDFSIS